MMSTDILITAFDAFPGVADNPTAALLGSFPDSPCPALRSARRLLLPTYYETAPARLLAALDPMPRAILMLGYSRRATTVTLESLSSSRVLPDRPDARGHLPGSGSQPITVNRTRANLSLIRAALREAGLESEISRDAGQYVCNHLYHAALSGPCAGGGGPIGLFVHLPAIAGTELAAASASAMTIDEMHSALCTIARLL